MKLGAKELRVSEPTKADLAKIKRRNIYIICDNVLDTYNIGSIFRLADAVAAREVILCGQTTTPPYHRITKAAVGTEKWVPWQYAKSAAEAIAKVKSEKSKCKVIAIEQHPKAIDYRKVSYQLPGTRDQALVFVVGHETEGVSKEVLKFADQILEIPMLGVNRSLNVMVSLAIVLYRALNSLP